MISPPPTLTVATVERRLRRRLSDAERLALTAGGVFPRDWPEENAVAQDTPQPVPALAFMRHARHRRGDVERRPAMRQVVRRLNERGSVELDCGHRRRLGGGAPGGVLQACPVCPPEIVRS